MDEKSLPILKTSKTPRNEIDSLEEMVEEGFVNKRRKVIELQDINDSFPSEDNGIEDQDDGLATVTIEDKEESKDQGYEEDDMFASDDDQPLSTVKNGQDTAKSEGPHQEPPEGDGIKLDAFNLEEESKTGVFDQFGNYTETKPNAEDEVQDQDRWYDDYKEDEQLQKAKKSQEKMAEDENIRREQFSKNKRLYTLEESLKRLLYFLDENETVLTTLGKLNVVRERYKKRKAKTKTSQKKIDEDSALHEKLCFQYVVHSINFLTELLDIVGKKGIPDVNELTRIRVAALIEEESLGDEPINDYETKLWSFKWLRDLATVNGPFTNYEMQSWKSTYFQDNVVVKYGDDDPNEARNWIHISCVHFM
ncbi:LAFA_0G02586g1_1 [Lachancea sp. 'fantastica']|nr:LAFA_0G02586g1_1 [Lachancea sp. 'fantastica']